MLQRIIIQCYFIFLEHDLLLSNTKMIVQVHVFSMEDFNLVKKIIIIILIIYVHPFIIFCHTYKILLTAQESRLNPISGILIGIFCDRNLQVRRKMSENLPFENAGFVPTRQYHTGFVPTRHGNINVRIIQYLYKIQYNVVKMLRIKQFYDLQQQSTRNRSLE